MRTRRNLADKSKASGNTPPGTSASGDISHLTAQSDTSAYDNQIAPAVMPAYDVWDNLDFGQILDQQFLDPAWLEEVQV
jgi:hypothetical protein